VNDRNLRSAVPTVSVVIPTRNRSRLLALALASALEQRNVQLEVIVIDEGSTDDTAAVVRSFVDERVRLIRHEVAAGKSAARNRGIAEAAGEWVAFLDDDDLWAPDKLARQLQAVRTSGHHWAYTGAVNITSDHRIVGGHPPRSADEVTEGLRRVNAIPGGCSSVLVRKRTLPADGFDTRYRLCEDWDLWIRLARVAPPVCVAQPLVAYRVHAGNSSADTSALLAEIEIIDKTYGGPVDRVVVYRHLARICLRANRQWPATGFYLRAAQAGGGSYVSHDFVADLTGVLQAGIERVRPKVMSRPRHTLPSRHPHGDWLAQASAWLDPFVLRHER
jgi:glycosyltransferase involved in cell wall biosynthesis